MDRRTFSAETDQDAATRIGLHRKIPGVLTEVITSRAMDKSQFPIILQGMSWDK